LIAATPQLRYFGMRGSLPAAGFSGRAHQAKEMGAAISTMKETPWT
jgi:hypothetical protein